MRFMAFSRGGTARKLSLAVLAGVLCWPSGGHAALTASELLRWCDDPELAAQSGCNGYFRAVIDLAELQTKLTVDDQTIMACLPAGISYPSLEKDLVAMMKDNVREHPDLGDFPASIAIYALLSGWFPCHQKISH